MPDKIGILTFHRTTNFGSVLQTYGLYRKIADLGYDCEIIDYRCPSIESRESLDTRILSGSLKKTIRNVLFLPAYKKKAAALFAFTNSSMKVSKPYTLDDIHFAKDQYAKTFVGSDIVWGRDITNNDYTYFLDYVGNNAAKYAFSSSVGDYSLRGDEQKIGQLLSQFNRIAVRERDACDWVEHLSTAHPDWVCDPTMLLTREEWENYLNPTNFDKNYVLVYFIDDKRKCLQDALAYAKKNHCQVYCINYDKPKFGVKNIKPKSLAEFLGLIMNAKMIFTASYHGMLFSIYFNKEFLFYTRAHKDRVLSLADRLGLSGNCGDNVNVAQYQRIDYPEVNKRVVQFREESTNVLVEMLHG